MVIDQDPSVDASEITSTAGSIMETMEPEVKVEIFVPDVVEEGEDRKEEEGMRIDDGFEDSKQTGRKRRNNKKKGKGRGKQTPSEATDMEVASPSGGQAWAPPYVIQPSGSFKAPTEVATQAKSTAQTPARGGQVTSYTIVPNPNAGRVVGPFTAKPTSPVYSGSFPPLPSQTATSTARVGNPSVRMASPVNIPTSGARPSAPVPNQGPTGPVPGPSGAALAPVDYRWDGQSTFLQIRDKTCVLSEASALEWWTLADSHTRNLKTFFRQNGSNLATISGGQIDHVREFALVKRPIVNQSLRALFILVGGNDLVIPNVPVAAVANNLMSLVNQIHQIRPEVTLITGSVICRKEGMCFVERQIELDTQIQKASPTHHHFITDVFSTEPAYPKGQREPRGLLYGPDGVHLNAGGEKVLMDVLGLVFAAVNTDRYDGKHSFYFQPQEERSFYFKF